MATHGEAALRRTCSVLRTNWVRFTLDVTAGSKRAVRTDW